MQGYLSDATYMYEIALQNDSCVDATIPKWKPVVVTDIQSAELHNANSYGTFTSLKEASKGFILKCGLVDGHPNLVKPIKIFSACLQYLPPICQLEEIHGDLQKYLPAHAWEKTKNSLQDLCAFWTREGRNSALSTLDNTNDTHVVDDDTLFASNALQTLATSSHPKRKRGGDNDLIDLRQQFKNAKDLTTRLDVAQQLQYQQEMEGSSVSNAARNFVGKTISPIINCLNQHFNGKVEDFPHVYGNIVMKAPTTFANKCCKGKETCNFI